MFSFDRVGERFRANAEHVVTIIDKVAGVFDCRLTGEGVARSEIVAQRQVRQTAWRKGQGWVMLSWRRRRCMRLERVEAEAEANVLIFDFGATAYSQARRREHEASSDAMARKWNQVALAVARKTGQKQFRIQFFGVPTDRAPIILGEVDLLALDAVTAIHQAARVAWPPRAIGFCLIDREGRAVFGRRMADRW